MENTYLFILNYNNSLDVSKYKEFSDIHIWNYAKIISSEINKNLSQNIYIYAKNMDELYKIQKDGFVPHLCFIGDEIFSSFYEKTLHLENIERFWFPNQNNIVNDKDKFLLLKNINQTPIAISFNEHIQLDVNYSDFFNFINEINTSYKNPLFEKDFNLQKDEIFSLNNKAIINNDFYYVILGLFGDYFLKNKPTDFELMSGIMKDKNCVKCEFAEICKNRGLGIIKSNNNIQSCIGIKLFNQS